jgi:CheY-like chemotaxis protein
VSELPLILVIEDEYFLQADLEKVLTEAGFATDIVSSGEEALTLLMDTVSPNMSEVQAFDEIRFAAGRNGSTQLSLP